MCLQAGDDPVEKGLSNQAGASLYARLLASLKLRADEDKTIGTWFVPSDRVSVHQEQGVMMAYLSPYPIGISYEQVLHDSVPVALQIRLGVVNIYFTHVEP